METKKVWFVTGASKGLGLSLVRKLLSEGYRVVATSRNAESLVKEIGDASDAFLPLEVNLQDDSSVKEAVEKSIAHFGQLDVIINNAGYGQIGTLEELSDEEARENFDVNVFGSLNVIRNVMPYLRNQGSGNIFNIASQLHLDTINGNQANDPEKAAEVLIAISKEAQPPVHLLLGNDAYDILKNKINMINQDAEQWKNYTLSTAYTELS
ncbi:SDR family NAD(P)-dependent oxidoreductase [Chryseobacterium daecheongense]|nr:SDR family NAD(P)-dependent oxidoreductase [Chryseobacterium daecheongense]